MSRLTRRDVLKGLAVAPLVAGATAAQAGAVHADAGTVTGTMTGAQALVETLIQEGVGCVFGIPGAQENELWDTMKAKCLGYLLVTHEFSAAAMADGYARSTGRPGVICVVPGPGLTNCLTGIGEALLDSVPMVCIVGDIARGEKYHAFQVHDLPQVALLQQVSKAVFAVQSVGEIPAAVRQAFQLALCGEPGPVGVVIPYPLLCESAKFCCPPLAPAPLPFDEAAFQHALALIANRCCQVGIYAGQGCMDFPELLVRLAETLQAPVATSVSGKGVVPDNHPLAVGYGYGPQGTRTAEEVFKSVDVVLALGVRFSEVSTAFYCLPQHDHLIQVDSNPHNLGRVMKTEVSVCADAGVFMERLIAQAPMLQRPVNGKLLATIQHMKNEDFRQNHVAVASCGADPVVFLQALRHATCPDALVFVDVCLCEHFAAETFPVCCPRTYFNPTDNQAMGWSIPAALGAQRVHPGRQVVTVTGDGCFLMTALEISTATRECLSVKFFVLDDQAYGYMQRLQKAAYARTTATVLPRLDYAALAKGFGVGYVEACGNGDLEPAIRTALQTPGPVLTRVSIDYHKRSSRWINAAKKRYMKGMSTEQKVRVAARLGMRALNPHPCND
jgi:acetolactate synthase-1/2/3 large subunit